MKILSWKRAALLAAVAAVAAALALAPFAAAADQPQQVSVPISFSLTDYTLCGFAIAESATGEIDKTIFPDGSQIWHIHRLSTFSANGKTLTSDANFTRFLDPTQPNLINDSGTIVSVQIPGEGAVYMQVGKLYLDLATGQVYFDAGPAQYVDHDTAAFCAYLSA
jgi:hypothetical protein